MGIRQANLGDLEQILAIYAPFVEQTAVSFEYDVPTLQDFRQRFCRITEQFPWLVWEQDGKILGYAYASAPFERASYRWDAEPSIYLAPQGQGQGIGAKLYQALEQVLTSQGYRTLYAIITSENRRSLAFHKKAGYTFLASFPRCGYKFGIWHGITWLQKELPTPEQPESFPQPACQVLAQEKMAEVFAKISLS